MAEATRTRQAPTAGYILELRDYLRQRFSKQKQQIREARSLRAMTHEITIPKQFEKTTQQVRTPLLADMVQRVVATLTVNYPIWTATPLGSSDRAQEMSTLKERWLAAAHRRMEADSGRRVFRDAMSAAVGDGMGVLQYIYRPYAYPLVRRRKDEEPDAYLERVNTRYQSGPFPFAWKSVDSLSYYYHDTGDGVTEVLLDEEMPLKPTMARLGVRYEDGQYVKEAASVPVPAQLNQSAASGLAGETRMLTTHWTDTHVTYLLDDKVARQIEHGFGKLPFFHFAGLSTHESAPERQFLPVFHAFQDLIPLLDRLLTMKSNVMYLMSFPQLILKLTQSRGGEVPGVTPKAPAVQLGDLLNLYTGESLEALELPPVGPDLNQLIQLTLQMIETTGIGRALRGDLQGDASGYLANQMITASQLTYDPITDNAGFAFERGAQFLLELVDRQVRRPVSVWGEKPSTSGRQDWLWLGPKDIQGYYFVQCRIDPLLPSNTIMEGRFGLEQWKQGAIPLKMHREKFLHMESPEDAERQMLIEEVKATPEVRQRLIQKVLQRAQLAPPQPQEPGPEAQGPGSMPLGNLGMPQAPGQGLPLVPPAPGAVLPPTQQQLGAGPIAQPGGFYGRQIVPPGGEGP